MQTFLNILMECVSRLVNGHNNIDNQNSIVIMALLHNLNVFQILTSVNPICQKDECVYMLLLCPTSP